MTQVEYEYNQQKAIYSKLVGLIKNIWVWWMPQREDKCSV